MTAKEIKEILESLDKIAKGDYYPEDLLYYENCKILLDYIINLQQDLDKVNDIIEKDRQFYKCRMDEYAELKKENEKLKECYCNRTDCSGRLKDSKKYDSVYQEKEDYKSRCLKAIEEINYWGIDKEHNDNSAMRLALGNILNILNGSDAK